MMTRNAFLNFGNIRAIDIIFIARVPKRNMGGPNDETVLLTEIKPLFQAPETAGMGNLGQHVYWQQGRMCMCFLLFFFWVSSMVKVHGKHPVRIVVVFLLGCMRRREWPLVAPVLGWASSSFLFFDFCACKTSPGQAIVALLLWQKRRADQDSFFLAPLLRGCLHVSLKFIGFDSLKMRPQNSSLWRVVALFSKLYWSLKK